MLVKRPSSPSEHLHMLIQLASCPIRRVIVGGGLREDGPSTAIVLLFKSRIYEDSISDIEIAVGIGIRSQSSLAGLVLAAIQSNVRLTKGNDTALGAALYVYVRVMRAPSEKSEFLHHSACHAYARYA